MSIITLPAQFTPRSCALRLAVSQRVSASPFGGSEEAVDLLNDRWLLSCEVRGGNQAEGAWLEAFIGSLRGQSNTVPLYHFARPAPLGTIRGNLTLSAATAQGASSIAVTGCQTAYSTVKAGDMFGVGGLLVQAASDCVSGGVNLLRYSEQFNNFVWSTAGTTVTPNTVLNPIGTYLDADSLIESSSSTTRHGLFYTLSGAELSGGVTFSVYVKVAYGTRRIRLSLSATDTAYDFGFADFNLATGNLIQTINSGLTSGTSAEISPSGNGWYRISVASIAISAAYVSIILINGDGAPSGSDYGYQAYASDDTSGVYLWGAQLERGLIANPYVPATLSPVGNITIPITNRLRVSQPSGAAVTWDKPTFNARLLDTSGVQCRSAVTEPVSFDFGEAI